MSVKVYTDYEKTTGSQAAFSFIRDWAKSVGAPAYLIEQTFTDEIRFLTYEAGTALKDHAFAGRIFGPEADVRWICEGDEYQIWRVAETPLSNQEFLDAEREERSYILWGTYDAGLKGFWERRIEKTLHYPLEADPDDHASIKVYEYTRARPDFTGMKPADITAILNEPYILAHRFVSLNRLKPPKGKTK